MKFISYQERRNKEKRLIRLYRVYNFGLFKIKRKLIPVSGDNNKIIIGGREISIEEKKFLDKYGKITIEGNNNTVELPNLKEFTCDIHLEGNNNIVTLTNTSKIKCVCRIIGNYNKLSVGKIERRSVISCDMYGNYNNRELSIGDIIRIANCDFIVLGNNRKIHVGKNCLFSWGIYIKTSDQHSVYDLETNKRINEDKDVVIGDNVWIGQDAYISKGSVIPSGCMVGAKAFVNKVITKENCVLAGIPAKIVKENIRWDAKLTE